MPRPDSATTIQRPDLGTVAYEYMNSAPDRGFIGLRLLPVFDTPLQSSEYPIIKLESLLKLQETARSPRGAYNRSDYEFKTDNYATKEDGWEELVDDSEAALYRRFFDAEEVAVMRATDVVLRKQESRIAGLIQATGTFSNSAVATEWSTITATPRADVKAAKVAMRAVSGLIPNVMAISWVVFQNLLLTTEIMTAFQYTNPIQLGGEEAQRKVLAQYFGLDDILVGNAIKDNAKKGQSKSIADIWDDEYAFFGKISSGGQDLKEPSLGRTFLWTADSPDILVTEQYRDEPHRSEVYRVRQNTAEKFTFTGAGYLLSNITA